MSFKIHPELLNTNIYKACRLLGRNTIGKLRISRRKISKHPLEIGARPEVVRINNNSE